MAVWDICNWIGLDWFGLNWFGLDWIGLDCMKYGPSQSGCDGGSRLGLQRRLDWYLESGRYMLAAIEYKREFMLSYAWFCIGFSSLQCCIFVLFGPKLLYCFSHVYVIVLLSLYSITLSY